LIQCGVYLRQSDDDEDTQLAVTRQWDEIIAKIITPRGWIPVRYCDNDRTAVGRKRALPERDRMLRDVKSGQLQAMAAWDCDRLYREPVDLEEIIDIADRNHTLLATVTGDIDLSTDNGRLFARIKGAVAKAETERRSARQKSKTRQLAAAGQNFSSRRSFGRMPDGSLNPVEAPVLAEAYELVLTGHSLNGIITEWNQRGILTSLGNKWKSPTQLSTILKNPRNAGWKSYLGEIIDDTEAAFEPIVSAEVWRAVNEILADPSRRPVDVARKYQLTGIAQCGGVCANQDPPVVSTVKVWKLSTTNPILVLRCRTCFGVVRVMSVIDDYINGLVIARLSLPDAAELLIDQKVPDLEQRRTEAAALRQRLKSLALDFADGELDSTQLKAATKRIKEKLAIAESVVQDANRARLFKDVVGPEGAQKFPGLHLDRRRAIISTLMSITLLPQPLHDPFDPESVVIEWKDPIAGR
jgi:DNA invertase Pin-like site-specific DNA recombinase